jgi:hypothetical protein
VGTAFVCAGEVGKIEKINTEDTEERGGDGDLMIVRAPCGIGVASVAGIWVGENFAILRGQSE